MSLDYFSITPYAWFGRPMKFMLKSSLTPENIPVDSKDPQILRKMVEKTFERQRVRFDFRIQHRPITENTKKVIEDASSLWSEEQFPFYTVAKLIITKKQKNSSERALTGCDDLSFNPWNSLSYDQPLDGINRARGFTYKALSDCRHLSNIKEQAFNAPKESEPSLLSPSNYNTFKINFNQCFILLIRFI